MPIVINELETAPAEEPRGASPGAGAGSGAALRPSKLDPRELDRVLRTQNERLLRVRPQG
jgi:hypothetical protein